MGPETSPILHRSPLPLRMVRSEPHLYSAICRARLAYSRYVAARYERALYRDNRDLFRMTEQEDRHCEELRGQGCTVLPEFFNTTLVDVLFEKTDRLFRSLQIDPKQAYSVQNRQRSSLEGLSYEELAASEKMIALRDPMLAIPEFALVAYNETIFKIVTNALGYVAPWYKPLLVRDFPGDRPRESSNFHKDNDEADSVQAFIYLVDIEDNRGPLVYVPGTNRYDVRSCRPRLARDLGLPGYDGRIADDEIARYYPRDSWSVLRVKRGSIAIVHGNGFHKGPAWPSYDNAGNLPRTAAKLDFHGHKVGKKDNRWKRAKIRAADYERLTPLQRLFVDESAVVTDD